MFENILFQDRAVFQLSTAIRQQSLPPAWLFHGPVASGKLTLALEFGRVLTCQADPRGVWRCSCPSCRRHYYLDSPNLVLCGYKDFLGEISLSSKALLKTPSNSAQRFHFYRAVKKLSKRLDPLLWNPSDPKLRSLTGPTDELAELLAELHPDLPEQRFNPKNVEKILKITEKISSQLPDQGLGIDGVRNIAEWCLTTNNLGHRIVVIEHADRLLAGARNALLKILEEPPQRVSFVLCTRHRASIIPTILSRVRSIELTQRTQEQMATVAQKIFQLPPGSVPLDIGLQGTGEAEQVAQFTDHFWEAARKQAPLPTTWDLKEVNFHAFLERLSHRLLSELPASDLQRMNRLDSFLEEARKAVVARDVFHQEHVAALDRIYLALREAL